MRSRGCTAVLELLATPARAIIIAADPGRRARSRGLPGGAAQEKIDVREIFGLVRFYTDDYLPVVFFTKRDDLFAFGHRLHTNYRRPFIGSQLRHSGFSLRVSNSSLSAFPRFCHLHGQPGVLDTQVDPLVNQTFEPLVIHRLAANILHAFLADVLRAALHPAGIADLPVGPGLVLGILVLAGQRARAHRADLL